MTRNSEISGGRSGVAADAMTLLQQQARFPSKLSKFNY